MQQDSPKRTVRFTDLDLSPDLIEILTRLKFVTPTPIQEEAIPAALSGRDVIGIAQTGTGKTLAFFLPMLQNINETRGMGLIVVPTRELALQVREEIDRVGQRLGFKTALLIGGADVRRQIRDIKRKPHVIVATPGRLNDHIERKTVDVSRVSVLVLDEADRMLDMGFAPQIDRILQSVPDERQTMLFSATMPEAISNIARKYMKEPVRIEVARAGTSAENIDQGVYYVDHANKLRLLQNLLHEYKGQTVLIFCRTKHGTKKMAQLLKRDGYGTEELHSNRTLNQRRRALENFKKGKSSVMVATDVAARGIDVKEIALVVNYDIPDQNEDYVHRIGRTGRASHKGRAVSFVLPEQYRDMKQIEKLVGKDIEVLELPGALTFEEVADLERRVTRPSGRGRARGRGGNRRHSGGGNSGYSKSSGSKPGGSGFAGRRGPGGNRGNRKFNRSGAQGAGQNARRRQHSRRPAKAAR